MSDGRLDLKQLLEIMGPAPEPIPEVSDRAELLAFLQKRLSPAREQQRLIRDAVDAGMGLEEAQPLTDEQIRTHRPLKRFDTLTGEEGELV